ncbi:SDR family oxidoreductase [Gilvimarinus sp. F26214L]|uniref:SDR family oxidoreductase n=1 Tax=Gilvimarinus sp. DZF01 TaxID=3461371 RepID=UPI0040453AA4
MQVVAVTGASAGIGRAIAKAFAREGARVGLIARSASALNEVHAEIKMAGGEALALPCDVSDRQAVESATDRIEKELGEIDIWVNCAMLTVFSRAVDIEPDEYRRVTDVTYHGYVHGTTAALKRMTPRNRGHIIQVGSALSYRSIPLQSAYCGAKHAVRGFSDSLRSELIHEGIQVEVSMVQLPAFNTPQFLWGRSHLDQKPQPLPPIHGPALAAEAIVWTAKNPQREVWVGWPSWQAILGNKLLPGFLDRYMAKKAWEGQFTGEKAPPHSPDNLFQTIDALHSEQGPFSDRSISRKPILWHVKNQNFWVNGAGFLLLLAVFLLGLVLG